MTIIREHKHFRYSVFQLEDASSTPHYQGYIEFKSTVRFAGVKRLLSKAHWEPRRGTQADAIAYSKKEDTRVSGPYEQGIAGGRQGKRTDIDDAVDILIGSRSITDVIAEHPVAFIKYHRGMERLLEATVAQRAGQPKCVLLYGPTGTGKSRWAQAHYPDAFWKTPNSKWFDGYLDQTTVIMDEFCGARSEMKLSYLLRLMDRYPLTVEVKGSSRQFLATTIVFTTNIHPKLWYDYAERGEQFMALARRFGEVYYMPTLAETLKMSTSSFFSDYFEGMDCGYLPRATPIVSVESSSDDDDEDDMLAIADYQGDWSDDLEDKAPATTRPQLRRVRPTVIGPADLAPLVSSCIVLSDDVVDVESSTIVIE